MTVEEAKLVGNIKVLVHREAFSKKEDVVKPRYYRGRRLRNVKDWVGKYVLKTDLPDELPNDSDSELDEENKEN
jgi:hypothetical protein